MMLTRYDVLMQWREEPGGQVITWEDFGVEAASEDEALFAFTREFEEDFHDPDTELEVLYLRVSPTPGWANYLNYSRG